MDVGDIQGILRAHGGQVVDRGGHGPDITCRDIGKHR